MQPRKLWLGTAILLVLSANSLWAQSNQICFTCALAKEKGKTNAKTVKTSMTPKAAPAPKAAPESPAPTAPKVASDRPVAPRASSEEVKTLHDLVAAQQALLESQGQQLNQLKVEVQHLREAAEAAAVSAQKAQSGAQDSVTAVNNEDQKLSGVVADLKAETAKNTQALEATKKSVSDLEHATTLHYKGITLTPGGFVTADTVIRTRNENADVTSNFGAAPFDGVVNSHLSEFRASARASRLTLLAEGAAGTTKLTGYYELDFLGQAPTANQIQTNSFTPRQRQLWGQAAFSNGLTLTAGQFWSLITTNRKGIATRAEYIPNTVEGSYVVGYNFVRQTAFRVTENFNDRLWAAFEVANPETNQPNASFVPANLFGFNNSANAGSPNGSTLNFLTGSTNGFSTNLAPDLLAKVAWEPGWGHYELKAVGRFFRDRINAHNNLTYGGGLGAAAVLPLVAKKADFLIEGLAGDGIGRYGAANGSDITLRPDGWIVPIHAFHTMTGLEIHPRPKLDLFVYGGDEYYRRSAYVDPTNPAKPAGYGSVLVVNTNCEVEIVPAGGAACGAQNKNVWSLSGSFLYRAYKGPFGTLQYGVQYEYLHRSTWSGVGGAPQGLDNVVLTSFRYLLP